MAVQGENRKLPISVKGSQDGGWMLAVRYLKPGVDYIAAIQKWLDVQRNDVVYVFVGFLQVPLGVAPRVYIARPPEIAAHLRLQSSGQGRAVLREDTPRFYPRSKEMDKIPSHWLYSTERIDTI